MTDSSPGPSKLKATIAFLAVYIIWGSTYLAIRIAIESMPPFLMAAARHGISGAILLAFALGRRRARATLPQLRDATIVGLLLLLGGNGGVSWAQQWVPSGLTALLVASVPLWMGVFAVLFHRSRRPRARGIAGIAIGFVGVGILVRPGGEIAGDAQMLGGAIGVLLAALCWAAGSLYASRSNLPADPIFSTGFEMVAGAAGLIVAGSATGEWARVDLSAVTARSALAWVYLALFGSIVAFSAYVWLLKHVSPAKVATYAYVNPAVAVALGATIGKEPIGPRTLVATAIIIGAVVMITSERASRPEGEG